MKELLCKWVSDDMRTMDNTIWEVGVSKELPVKDDLKLCCPGLFHYYRHPLLAVLFKFCHGCQDYTKLYEVVPEGKIIHTLDKAGCTKLTLIKEMEIPEICLTHRIAFAIICSLSVFVENSYVSWASQWLNGKDRSVKSANLIRKNISDNRFEFFRDMGHCGVLSALDAINAALLCSENENYLIADASDLACLSSYYAIEANSNLNLIEIVYEALECEKG